MSVNTQQNEWISLNEFEQIIYVVIPPDYVFATLEPTTTLAGTTFIKIKARKKETWDA